MIQGAPGSAEQGGHHSCHCAEREEESEAGAGCKSEKGMTRRGGGLRSSC